MASFSAPSQRSLRIVIVEDEPFVAYEMEAHLSDAGHEVVGVADTVSEALRLAQAGQPDLVLVDIQLADGGSGFDVARDLHARGIACLFATGNCPGQARNDAVGCLHKPYDRVQLLDAVAAADAAARGERPERVPHELHLYR